MSNNVATVGWLHRIAQILGVPVSAFFGEALPDDLFDATECLRLWSRLTTDEGRAAALDALRKALNDEGGERICCDR